MPQCGAVSTPHALWLVSTSSLRGGVGVACAAHDRYLQRRADYGGWLSLHDDRPGGRWRPALRTLRGLGRTLGGSPSVLWIHAGGLSSLARALAVARRGRAHGARVLLQLHAPELERWLATPARRAALRRGLGPVHALGALSPWWADQLRGADLGRPVLEIPNALPPEAEAALAAAAPQTRPELHRLLVLSRLVPGKNIDVVLEAMQRLPAAVSLVVAGDGPLREGLMRRASVLGLDNRVRFPGWVDAPERARLLRTCDALVQPTRYESFGLAFAEAMAFGRPVVALRTTGVADVVPAGRAGVLLDEASPAAVAAAVHSLTLAEDRQRMGDAGREHVRIRYRSELVQGRLDEALARLISL